MSEQYRLHEVPEGWPESARWDESVRNALRRFANIKGILERIERVLKDPNVCRAAATAPITSRNLRAVEVHVAQAWNELAKFAEQMKAEQAESERKVAESGRELQQKVTEGQGERLRYVCGRIDFDED